MRLSHRVETHNTNVLLEIPDRFLNSLRWRIPFFSFAPHSFMCERTNYSLLLRWNFTECDAKRIIDLALLPWLREYMCGDSIATIVLGLEISAEAR